MAEPRPAKFPEYARVDIVDVDSGVNNVVEPSESKKDLGHGPEGEFPPRQYMNWLHRITYKWLKYFDENTPQETVELTGTTSNSDVTYHTLPPGFTVSNTHILSLSISIDTAATPWHQAGFNATGPVGGLTAVIGGFDSVGIQHPNTASYHSRPYKMLIARKPTV